MNDYPERISI